MSTSRPLLATATLMAVGLSCAAAADTLTIAFDPQGETTSFTTSTPYQQVTAYLLLLDATGEEAINAWECTVDVQTDGAAPPITWTLAGNGLNIMEPPEFIVGLPVPLPNADVVLLATATIFVPDTGQEIAFHLLPSSIPSLIQPLGYPVQQPDWAPPPGQGFVMAPPASGCTALPVSVINDDGVDPVLEVTLAGDGDFGTVEVGTLSTRVLQLHNAGSTTVCGLLTLTGEDFRHLHDGGPYTSEPTWCRLEPGESLPVQVLFSPSTPGPHGGDLVLDCAGALASIALSGSAQLVACDVTPASIDFGLVELGSAPARTVTVANAGSTPLQGHATLAPGPFHITAGAGAFSLAPGDTHRVEVVFDPPAEATYDAILELGTEDCDDVPLHGVGVDSSPICQVAPPELAGGEVLVGMPVVMNLTVGNAGETAMSVNPQIVSSVFTITQGGGPQVVAPGGNLLVRVRFLASEAGNYEGVVLLGSAYCADVPVTASAYAGEYGCDWDGLELGDFGEQPVGSETPLDIRFRNTGDYALTDVTFSVTGATFAVASGAGPVTVPAGGSHIVRVAFSPGAPVTYTGQLFASTGACDPLPLTGQGLQPPPSTGDGMVIAFDPLGETTTMSTTSPFQPVTAYLLLISPNNATMLYGWECTVEVETTGPAPAISWTVAHNGLNIGTPPEFIVGLPMPQQHADVRLLATATIYVPSPDQEIALHILPSPLPSLWDPPGYRVQQPIWVGAPGSPFIVAPPLSGCSGQPVCVVNDDGDGPPLFLSADGDTDFGAVATGSDLSRTITVTNPYPSTMCGTLTLSGDAYDYRHGTGDWTTQPTWCRIAPGASLDVQVRFSPLAVGPHYGDLIVESCGPLLVLPLTGGGDVAPPVSLAPRSLEFGWTELDDLRELICTVHNDGDAPLNFSPQVVASEDFALADDTTDFALDPGDSRPIVVRFSPTTLGAQMGRIAFGQAAAPDLLLHGTALPISIDCLVLLDGNGTGDCGELALGQTTVRTVTIHNVGTEVLAGDIALLGDPEAFTITAGGGWVELAPGASHVVTVAVTPPAEGSFAATLSTPGGCQGVAFSVVGFDDSPICQVAPPELAGGEVLVGMPVVMNLTVGNAGETAMSVNPQIVSSVFTITQGGGPQVVAPGGNLLVRVRFLASEAGNYEGVVLLGSAYCADVPVTASAYAGEYGCDWSGLTLGDWGDQVIGTTSSREFTFRNTGDYPLADLSFSVGGSAFAIASGAGPVTVAAGASHVVRVVFSPSAAVTYTSYLTPSTGGCDPLPLTGEGVLPPVSVDDALIIAFDLQGETTTITTSTPNQAVTAYLLLLSPNGYMALNGWECTVEVETAGPAPTILWNVAYNGLNIVQPPQFIVGLPVPQYHLPVRLLATATVYVPSPDQEIAFHILPSSYPSLIQPPGYPVQQPVWAGPPGMPFSVAAPASGCATMPVCAINDDGQTPPPQVLVTGDPAFGAVPVGDEVTRTLTFHNPGTSTFCGEFAFAGPGFAYQHGNGTWTTEATWCRLAPGADLPVQVRFTPQGSGPHYGELILNGCGPVLAFALTGGGDTAPPVTLVPPQVDFGFVAINDLQDRTCTIHNDGNDPLLMSPALVEGDDFALVGDTSEFLLPAGATRDLTVRFGAGDAGAQLGRVVFGQSAAPDLLLRGTVLPPSDDCAVTLDGNGSGDCGVLVVGSVLTRTALIRNTGTETLAGDIMLVGDLDAFTITAGGGWTTLPPGGLHTVSIDVVPPAVGLFTATLHTLGGCASVGLAVTGVAPVLACSVVPDSLDFGLIAMSTMVSDTVTVTNTGNVSFSGAATLPPGPFSVAAGGGDFVLAAGQSRDIVVAFAPVAVGTFTAALDLGADACADVPCRGEGREYGPYCVVTPETIDGGEVPVQVPVTYLVTVHNQGETPLGVNAQISAAGFSIVAGGGPHEVAPGAQLAIHVRFVGPEPGVYTASLDLGTESCTDVPITVLVRDAIVSCAWDSANPLDVGVRAIGSITQLVIAFENTGEIALPNVTFTLAGEGFLIVAGAGPVTIPTNGVHNVLVAFIPTELGSFAAQLTPSIACCEPLTILGESIGSLPSCSVDPTQVTFVPTCVGSPRVALVQVVNGGPGTLVVFPTVEGAAFTATWTSGFPLWLQVPPNASRTITVTYAPPATGDHTGLLGLGDTGCAAVPLAGTAITGPAVCAVDAETLDFGDVEIGYHADRPLVVTNEGCLPLTIAPVVSGPGFHLLAGGDAGEIAPGETRTIVVRLTPEALGPATGLLELGGPDCPAILLVGACIPVSLTCYTLPAYLNVDFLPLSQVRTKMFSIHNAGSADVALAVASVPGRADVLAGGGSFTLPPGATRTVQASFHAPAYGQTIWQWSFGAACRPLMVVVYGADAICHVRPAYIDFGTTTLGSTVVRNWVVSNPGVATVTYTVGCEDPNFEWSPTGTRTLAPGYAFGGSVTFAPQAVGTHDAYLAFNSETAYPIDMHGVAVDELPRRRFDVARLDFGAVGPGEGLTRRCLLLNESTEALSGEVSVSGGEFRIVDGAGEISVPAGGSREIRVRYSTSRTGDHAAVLRLAGTDLTPVELRGRCFVPESDSNRVAIVWDDGADAMAASSDLFDERELSGRVVLRDPSGAAGLFAWQGRLIARGGGQFTTWQLPAGATNLAEAPAFDVVMNGDIPPLAPEITLATFGYVVPAGGQADFLLAGAAGEEPLGWPIWRDAAEPDSALVVSSAGGDHVVAMIRPQTDQVVPGLLRLHPPYPNPFNPMTTLAFDLGEPGHAQLALYDLAGRRVTTVVDADLPAGRHEYTWLGRDEGGHAVPSGTYHLRLVTGGQTRTCKLSLIR